MKTLKIIFTLLIVLISFNSTANVTVQYKTIDLPTYIDIQAQTIELATAKFQQIIADKTADYGDCSLTNPSVMFNSAKNAFRFYVNSKDNIRFGSTLMASCVKYIEIK